MLTNRLQKEMGSLHAKPQSNVIWIIRKCILFLKFRFIDDRSNQRKRCFFNRRIQRLHEFRALRSIKKKSEFASGLAYLMTVKNHGIVAEKSKFQTLNQRDNRRCVICDTKN